MPKKKRRAPRLHALEIERAQLPDGTRVEMESSMFSTEAGLGLQISIDLPDEEDGPGDQEPPVRSPEER